MTGQNACNIYQYLLIFFFFSSHKYCKIIRYLSVSSTKKYDLAPMRAVNNLLFVRLHSHSYMLRVIKR